ncbi:MAG: SCO family protein [Planctomycetota bacterium]
MKTAIHVFLILVVGVGLGLTVRSWKRDRTPDRGGPADGEQVFRDDQPFDAEAAVNATPSKPPEDEHWLSRFELTERSGEQVSSEDLLGQPYVVSFFFSTCPASCVTQNQKLKELQDQFAGQGVRFVAISVDPEHDSPEILREYAARFGADKEQWLFMTGDLGYIRRVGAEVFMQPVEKKFHTDRFVLVDKSGEIEGFYLWPESSQFKKLKSKISELIEQKS